MPSIEVGDLFFVKEGAGCVQSLDHGMRTVLLRFNDGPSKTCFIEDLKDSKTIRPSRDWFLCAAPLASSPMVGIEVYRRGKGVVSLRRYWSWVADPFRKGGPFYLNPHEGFKPGDVLTLVYGNNRRAKYVVPVAMKTFKERKEESQAVVKEPENDGFFGVRL